MTDLARVKRNVSKMAGMGAPEAEIDAYIASEGTTVDAVRTFQAPAAPKAAEWVTPGQGKGGVPIISDLARSLYPFEQNTATGDLRLAVPKIIPQLAEGAVDAVTLPGDVATGKTDPMSDSGIARSIGFASTISPGGLRPSVMPPVSKSAQNIARAMKDDGLRAADLPRRLDELGPGSMLMDLGPNLQAQAGALAAVPGPAQATLRDALALRAKAASGRVADDVQRTIGTGPDIDQLKQSIVAEQSAASKPLYDAVRTQPLPLEGNFRFVLQTPLGKDAFRQAANMAANDGIKVDGLTVGLVDYAKRVLDDKASSAMRSGDKNAARQASEMASLLRRETDKLAPGYADARAAFAGPAAVLDAVDSGYGIFGRDVTPAQLSRQMQDMTSSERDAFLAGAQSWVEAQLGNAVNDVASLRNTFRRGWNAEKLQTLLGKDVADDLLNSIERELQFGRTANAVAGNSETARRALAAGEVSPDLKPLHPEGVVGLASRAFNWTRAKMQGMKQPKVQQDMAQRLASELPSASPSFISEVDRAMKPQPFLPTTLLDLLRADVTRKAGSVEDQLSAAGLLRGPHT